MTDADEIAIAEMNDRRQALGELVEVSAHSDFVLRSLFCALIGSPYAAIVAAGQSTNWLIENCKAILQAHRGLKPEVTQDALAELAALNIARLERNRFIHRMWGHGAEGIIQVKGKQRDYKVTNVPTSTAEVRQVTEKLQNASSALQHWTLYELGPDAYGTEAQLRWLDHVDAMSDVEREALRQRQEDPFRAGQPDADGQAYESETPYPMGS
jgi:hypothetical protein